MIKITLVLFLLVVNGFVYAQTITVKEYETGKPIEMAVIVSDSPKALVKTNADGQAEISTFVNSPKIGIRMMGYKTEILSYDELVKLNFEVTLTPSTTQFDPVVVSATKSVQSSGDVPSKISVISTRDVALLNPQTAADLLALSGEVAVQKSQQGGGSPMIRGFSTNRLLYTVDGVRMNSAIFRAGNIQNVISLDAFAIENTEVFFGPGSIIYGSDAIGGVMSFQTLSPQFSLTKAPLTHGKAVSRYSSANNEITNHFDVMVGWKKWATVTSLTHSKFGDLKMGKYGPDDYLKNFYVQRIDSVDHAVDNPDPLVQNPSGYAQINMMQKIQFSPTKNWDFEYGFHYSETSSYSRYDRLIETESNGLPTSAVWNYGPQIWMLNNFAVTHNKSNKLYDHVALRVAHQYFEESRIDRKFNHHRLRTTLDEVRAYSANLDFEKSAKRHRFHYGFEYVMNDVSSFGSAIDINDNSPILVPDRYPASQWSSYAGYLSYQFVASEKFLIQTGLRYNGFKIESDFTRNLPFFPFDFTTATIQNDATTGSIGLIYKPNDSWKISVNASTGFRAPNVDDIGKMFDFADGEIVVPNTQLEAEYAYNGEFNISKIFNDVVKLDFTGFYTYLDNAMVRRAFQVNGEDSIMYDGNLSEVYAVQNAAFGTVYGFNAGIEIRLPQGFSISSKYNYQLGEEEMENGDLSRSRHAAPAFGTTRLTYQRKKLTMQLYAMYSAEVSHADLNEEEKQKPFIYAKDGDGNPYSPRWYTLNFKAMYNFHVNFTVSAGLENITDQRYRTYSSGLVASGRNMVISLKANF